MGFPSTPSHDSGAAGSVIVSIHFTSASGSSTGTRHPNAWSSTFGTSSVVFMTPSGLAKLKVDTDFLANIRSAGVRGDSNPLFSGSMILQDGMVIHEFRHVFNTKGAASGSKWGSTGTTDGQAVLFLGAQALAMADIGDPYWVEETFDFGDQHGISIGKMLGFKKSVFHSTADGGNADYNVLRVNTLL